MRTDDRAWTDYSADFRTRVLPAILDSAVFLSIYAEDADVRQATEIGFALLLGKPVIILVPCGRTVPDGLRRAADIVIDPWDPSDRASQDAIATAFESLAGRE